MRFGILLVPLACAGEAEALLPTIPLVKPADGATICASPAQIELEIANFELVPMSGEGTDGEGHIDFTVNGPGRLRGRACAS